MRTCVTDCRAFNVIHQQDISGSPSRTSNRASSCFICQENYIDPFCQNSPPQNFQLIHLWRKSCIQQLKIKSRLQFISVNSLYRPWPLTALLVVYFVIRLFYSKCHLVPVSYHWLLSPGHHLDTRLSWLCSGWALDWWSKGRWFDSRPGRYQVN